MHTIPPNILSHITFLDHVFPICNASGVHVMLPRTIISESVMCGYASTKVNRGQTTSNAHTCPSIVHIQFMVCVGVWLVGRERFGWMALGLCVVVVVVVATVVVDVVFL